MKGLVQKVSDARVCVDGIRIGQIGQGLLLLLGVEKHDDTEAVRRLCERVLNFRIFPDDSGRMNLSVCDISGALLVVPQFTLAADTRSGNRPSFSPAASPDRARHLFRTFVAEARVRVGEARVAEGQFGADMKVTLTNDGPVTFMLESAD